MPIKHDKRFKHGESYTRLHRIWDNMKARCYNVKSDDYARYGGRGITVCDEWASSFSSFSQWAKSSGYSETLTLDRIENNEGYSPKNCRWVDRKAQANNTRNCICYTYNGETHTLAEWADIVNIPKTTLWNRLKMYGWGLEKALTTPVAKRSNNAKNSY